MTFNPGQTTRPVLVALVGDSVPEQHEALLLHLSAPENAAILDGQAVGTILNDDPPSVSVAPAGGVIEGDAGAANVASFSVTLNAAPATDVSVGYTTVNGTARSALDYGATSGTLTFTPTGPLSQTVTVPVLGDILDEPDETFILRLRQANGVSIVSGDASATIPDDDAPPTVTIGDATVTEGNTGTRNASLTVTLSAASGHTVTVAYQTLNGSAVAPADYTAASDILTFSPGQTSKTVRIAVAGDLAVEGPEEFSVVLGAVTNVAIADGQGLVTIVDNDR
jgi:chitinase